MGHRSGSDQLDRAPRLLLLDAVAHLLQQRLGVGRQRERFGKQHVRQPLMVQARRVTASWAFMP